jgi:hypothetical protein
MSLLARAEAVNYRFELAGAPHLSPLPPIDSDAVRLADNRRASAANLRHRLRRQPTAVELAVDVALFYRGRGWTSGETAVRTMHRLIREAQRYEFVFPGLPTGRDQLPPARD